MAVAVGRDESDLDADDAGRATTIPESSEAATLSDSMPPPCTDVEADVDDEEDDADGIAPLEPPTLLPEAPALDRSLFDLDDVDRCEEKRGGGGGGCVGCGCGRGWHSDASSG